jgi:hypothetical protein
LSSSLFFKRSKQVKEREIVQKSSAGEEKPYTMFQLTQLNKVTNCFSHNSILGSGCFGEVYYDELEDETHVAVKKARVGKLKSTQLVHNEVSVLSRCNHKNLVRQMWPSMTLFMIGIPIGKEA